MRRELGHDRTPGDRNESDGGRGGRRPLPHCACHSSMLFDIGESFTSVRPTHFLYKDTIRGTHRCPGTHTVPRHVHTEYRDTYRYRGRYTVDSRRVPTCTHCTEVRTHRVPRYVHGTVIHRGCRCTYRVPRYEQIPRYTQGVEVRIGTEIHTGT